MPKQLVVELDPRDSLDAKLLLDYIGAADQQQWLKRCLLIGYLVITGELEIMDPEEDLSQSEAAVDQARKGVGNQLFGIKKS
jgi:hypothetical protein